MNEWDPFSWRSKPNAQEIAYPDVAALERVIARMRKLPPLVTSWEIERLRAQLSEAEDGKRFVLQGGDCAESLEDCTPGSVTNKLKILLQMSLVLVHGLKKPVVRIGRFAGQYAKPRSSATEVRNGVSLPSYYGDMINRSVFNRELRTPDPELLLQGYFHAGLTINFVRSLVDGGFADLHHPEYWNLSFVRSAGLSQELRGEYERMCHNLADGLRFMEALGEKTVDDLTRVEFFTSHEGLSLWYEAAQTRRVPRREGYYDLSTHLPWVGERTRGLDGAHVEYFRGIRNPIGIKLSSNATGEELVSLARVLNPANEKGKLVFVSRMGAGNVERVLPGLLRAATNHNLRGLWVCDPMHGNTRTTSTGIKTRNFSDILSELRATHEVHRSEGVPSGGVHFELTGEDVTECVGGATGLSEQDLATNYVSQCDPRLNYQQSLEMAFLLAKGLAITR